MSAICKYCHNPVVLTPSAAERARRYGGTAAEYTALFPNHSACEVEARSKSARESMQRINTRQAGCGFDGSFGRQGGNE